MSARYLVRPDARLLRMKVLQSVVPVVKLAANHHLVHLRYHASDTFDMTDSMLSFNFMSGGGTWDSPTDLRFG